MDSSAWNQRYEGSELLWSAAPNIWVRQGQGQPAEALDALVLARRSMG